MSENGFQFRTAAFGGFQKQDVMDYLERSAQEHARKVATLQKELEEERRARAGAEEYSDELSGKVAALEEENQRLSAELADRAAQLEAAIAEGEELRAVIAGLQEEVDRLTPSAAAYEAVKERTASIELEAHGRAQIIEEEARKKAQKTREELLDWIDKMQNAYVRLRADMDDTVAQMVKEIQLSGSRIESVADSFSDYDAALNALRAQAAGIEPKMPQPLRAEEPKEEL